MQRQAALVRKRRCLQIGFLALFGVLCAVSFFLDDTAIRVITEHRTKTLKNFAGYISDYGDWPFLMLYTLPFLVWARWKKRTALLRMVIIAIISCSLAGLVANVGKLITGRTRPNNLQVNPGWYGLRYEDKWIVGKNKFASFPSGHTASTFGLFSVLAFRRKRWAFLWFTPAIIMACSRMVVDAHHLSDVCFGAWFGLIAAWWCMEKWKIKNH